MTSKDVFGRMPESVIRSLKQFREMKDGNYLHDKELSHRAYEYTNALRDAGFITEVERRVLFLYTTI